MKTQLLLSLVLAGSVVASSAFAEEAQQDQSSNTSTIKMTDVQKKDEKMKDIDEEITNAKMRAESGSKSKYSVSLEFSLNGGNLEDPLGKVRPNYSGIATQDGSTSLVGEVGVSYRINPKNRLSLSTGVSVGTPFHSNMEEVSRLKSEGGVTDVSTPSLSWGTSGRIGTTQNSLSVGYSHHTKQIYTDGFKMVGDLGISHVVIFDIEGSNWQPGLSTSIGNTFYSDGANSSDVIGNDDRRADYYFGVYPFVEYAFNDRYSFRTVFRPMVYSHNRSDDAMTFEKDMYTQSMGVGIAVTRDIYLYPNMQFAPENLKPSLTNVGLSTTMNIF